MTESLPLDGRSLTIDQVVAVARGGCPVSLDPEARARVGEARRAVERAIRAGRPVYGVTTGFGSLSDRVIPSDQARQLQLGLVRSHASGTGAALPKDLVRAMILLRANSLARGYSGVRVEVVERLLELLNVQLTPVIPEQGSVGASGDLAPLAHLALALIGEGEFLDRPGGRVPAATTLERQGLPPLTLHEKEGVALVNGTALMGAYLALGAADAGSLLAAAEIAAAMAFDALQGDPASLDDRLGELRNLAEQRTVAASVRALLEGTTLARPRPEYSGQDPYTLRCLPQVFAAVLLGVGFAEKVAAAELNAVTDNPVVDGDEFVNGGNFHGQNLALALDCLGLAVQYVAGFSERRTSRLVHPALNRGLPAFLTPKAGLGSGLMIPQYLAAALVNENATLAHPASATSLPTSADQEDFVSMGAWSGSKLFRMLANARRVVAVEWIAAGQALELRRPAHGGRGSEAGLRALRALVAPWSDDRSPAPDVERVASAIADGSLVQKVRADCPF